MVKYLEKLVMENEITLSEEHTSLSSTKVALAEVNESLKTYNKIIEDTYTLSMEENAS